MGPCDAPPLPQNVRMLLEDWLRLHDAIAHTSELYAAGFGKHALASAVERGVMLRVRRSWIALPDCDGDLIRAITAGGRLTCISEARRLGLWVPPADPRVHVMAPAGSGKMALDGVRIHWSNGPAPVRRRAPAEPLVNVLHHVAQCLEPSAALAIWDSALNKRRIAPQVLERVSWRGRLERSLASRATALSDSGLETEFVEIMQGIGVSVRQQVWIDGHPVDALIGDRLIVQLDGFAHHGAAARRRDLEADARLRLRGYTVLRFDYQQVFFRAEYVRDVVRMAIAQGLHLAG